MAYQQPPYQTTVMQPAVVVPVVTTNSRFGFVNSFPSPGPAHLRNGARCCGILVPGMCIIFMCFIGCGLFFMGLFILMTTNWDMDFWRRFNMSYPPTLIPGIILPLIGVLLAVPSCYLCGVAKKKYNVERSQQNTAPHSEPYTNTSGHIYSGQGQPAAGVPVAANQVYVPMQSGVMNTNVYPAQSTIQTTVVYPAPVSSVHYSSQMGVDQQPPYPGMGVTAPGGMASPEPPPYSGHEKDGYAPEYNKQPAYAPPSYPS